MNYRNTPHHSTGKAPNELIMGRLIRTKIVTPIKPAKGKSQQEAMLQDKKSRKQTLQLKDRKKKAVHRNFKIKRQKTATKPPFDPKSYTNIKIKGTQVIAVRETQTRVRNIARCKLLHI